MDFRHVFSLPKFLLAQNTEKWHFTDVICLVSFQVDLFIEKLIRPRIRFQFPNSLSQCNAPIIP